MKKVVIHTDGGCHGNPGPGAWAAILKTDGHTKEIAGADKFTTNNRMELAAAIQALKALKQPCEVELWTDSSYLAKGYMEWMPKWKANGWQRKPRAKNKPVMNLELWQELDKLGATHKITFHWLRGHNGHPLNERCDALVQQAIDSLHKDAKERPNR
ncbi:MAG: ribonuclease HI [Planctomycetes bacterium]|nr:ribonuclease HI [Planctomycetota bacterium]